MLQARFRAMRIFISEQRKLVRRTLREVWWVVTVILMERRDAIAKFIGMRIEVFISQ